jgi:hypothetical protein
MRERPSYFVLAELHVLVDHALVLLQSWEDEFSVQPAGTLQMCNA